MRKNLFILCPIFLVTWAGIAAAKTPDGQPPSVETVCDSETGAAFGLCNAYCEAMDCDSPNHSASDAACESVRRNFEKKTGRPIPCEVTCPCVEQISLFAEIVSGEAQVEICIADAATLSVVVEEGDFAVVTSATIPPSCSANLQPPFVELTPSEVIACRDVLRRAAEAQGVHCGPPE